MEGDALDAQAQQNKPKENPYGNYGGYENGKKVKSSIADTAAQNLKEQTLGETAGVIVDKAKKSIFKGILGNMDF